VEIKYLEKGNSDICNKVLRSLPDWFGIEEAIVDYVNKSKEMSMLIAIENDKSVGFISIKNHSPYTSEVYVMGVLTDYHRSGIGNKLLVETEKVLKQQGIEFLQVKTLSPERECEYYKKTRIFYQSYGFKEVETFPTLWDESNPCLLMIKTVYGGN
jgi:ribosomal protein S18 acetylase RimI-like enzyme